ncbi:FlgD immunoglobulin-like domain containing protein [bacterium]
MKSRLFVFSIIYLILILFAAGLRANGGLKDITFQYIRNSDYSYPGDMSMASGYYEYDFWTGDGMVQSAHSTTISYSSIGGMGGVIVTFDIGISPISWDASSMASHPYVYLQVTNPYLGETALFSGTLNYDWLSQTFTDDYALPVELLSFTVRMENEIAVLKWETASEVNNAGFNIYKSSDYDGDFELINMALIPGEGNNSSGHVYTFKDINVQLDHTYYYKLENVDLDGKTNAFGPVALVVGNSDLDLPDDFELIQNYPNPFNPITTIEYNLPEVSDVMLSVYNIQGQLIEQLVSGIRDAGYYAVQWNGVRTDGNSYPSGIYFYELRTDSYRDIKKMFFVK